MGEPARREEMRIASAGLALAVLAAAVSSPFDAWFLPNAGFFLAEEALMLLPLLFLWPRRAVAGGVLLSTAVCLVAFPAWCAWRHETPGWVLFAMCLPGGLAGSLVAALASLRWSARRPSFVAGASAAIVLGALLANAVVVERWFS